MSAAPRWLLADLDGDRKLDLIVQNGAGSPAVTLDRAVVPAGASVVQAVRLHATDVDHDNDLDFVIRCEFSGATLGWWRNDGHGRFVKGDPRRLPKSDQRTPHTASQHTARKRLQRPYLSAPQSPVALPLEAGRFELASAEWAIVAPVNLLPRRGARRAAARGPPSPSVRPS